MFRLFNSYIFWAYERGSVHYDVLVTAILVFMFVSPHIINYNDKPVETVALHASEVLVKEAGTSGGSSQLYPVHSPISGWRKQPLHVSDSRRRHGRRKH